jgi:hypothetical protein
VHDSLEDRLIEYEFEEAAFRTVVKVTLDNTDGALADAGDSLSSVPRTKRGAELYLYRGLAIGGVDYTSLTPPTFVESMTWARKNGVDVLILTCVGWDGLLSGWRATRLLQWSATTPAVIAGQLCAKVGMTYSETGSEGSDEQGNLTPDFVVLPGQDGLSAMKRLMRLVPDVLRSDGVTGIYYKELDDSETADYNVGGTNEHPIIEAGFVEGSVEYNGVVVQGESDVLGQAWDLDEIEKVGQRQRWIMEELYTTGAEAGTQANADLLRGWVESRVGYLSVFPIHGLELWDVLQVTYPAGWSGTRKYRVVGIRESLNRRRGRYQQKLSVLRMT